MKRSHKTAAGIVAALSLGVAAAAFAQPGPMGDGKGPQGKAGMQHGTMGGMQHGAMGGMQHGVMGHASAGMGAAHSLMTPEERTALQQKMHDAKTPEQHRGPRAGATSESDTHTH